MSFLFGSDSEDDDPPPNYADEKALFLRTGQNPLTAACMDGKRKLVSSLLRNGADPNVMDYTGMYPLHCACLVINSMTILEALLAGGADPNARVGGNIDGGETPMHYIVRDLGRSGSKMRTRFAYTLLRYGADTRIRARVIDPLVGRRKLTAREYATAKGRKRLGKILKSSAARGKRAKKDGTKKDGAGTLSAVKDRSRPAIYFISFSFFVGLTFTKRNPIVAGFMFGASVFAALLFVVTEYSRRNDRGGEPSLNLRKHGKKTTQKSNTEIHLVRNTKNNPLRRRKNT